MDKTQQYEVDRNFLRQIVAALFEARAQNWSHRSVADFLVLIYSSVGNRYMSVSMRERQRQQLVEEMLWLIAGVSEDLRDPDGSVNQLRLNSIRLGEFPCSTYVRDAVLLTGHSLEKIFGTSTGRQPLFRRLDRIGQETREANRTIWERLCLQTYFLVTDGTLPSFENEPYSTALSRAGKTQFISCLMAPSRNSEGHADFHQKVLLPIFSETVFRIRSVFELRLKSTSKSFRPKTRESPDAEYDREFTGQIFELCLRCHRPLPDQKRFDAKFCGTGCKNSAHRAASNLSKLSNSLHKNG